ncbi:MAG: hypothetical protein NVSMB9_02360 [Isosphaeraceae bacterium]
MIKLTAPQADLLSRVADSGAAGYLGNKKAEHRVLETLNERKLIKKGTKDKVSGHFHYQVSSPGKRILDAPKPAPTVVAGNASPTPPANAVSSSASPVERPL